METMTTVRKLINDAVGKLPSRELTVEDVREISLRFKRVDLAGAALRDVSVAPGDKVQVMLDEGLRTYSPFSFDAARGAMSLLIHRHSDAPTPGALWFERVAKGDRVRIFGPRSSLALAAVVGPVVLFGDETSFGVARSLVESRKSSDAISCVFETSRRDESRLALDALALPNAVLVERRDDGSHLTEIEEHVRSALARSVASPIVLTGKAQSIQALRNAFRARRAERGGQMVKAYWSPGKRGLD